MRYEDIEPMMRDRWDQFFLQELGIEVPDRHKKNMPCPVCGGDDRAHFRNDEGRLFLYCRHGCGSGGSNSTSPEELVMKLGGIDFPELVKRAAEFSGYAAHNYTQHKTHNTKPKAPRTVAESALSVSEIKRWFEIPVTARNAITGDNGEFLSINGNLAVPMYFYNQNDKDKRPRLTCVVEVLPDEKTKTHGFSRGSFATVGALTEDKVFCTCYISALLVNKITGKQCIFSPSPKAFKRAASLFGVNYVFVKAPITDIETIDLALLAYYDLPTYLIPHGNLGKTRRIITRSYEELVDAVLHDERLYTIKREAVNGR